MIDTIFATEIPENGRYHCCGRSSFAGFNFADDFTMFVRKSKLVFCDMVDAKLLWRPPSYAGPAGANPVWSQLL